MNYVIGSGPPGVAVAQALLARGEEVCMVDAGLTLEPERQEVLTRMSGLSPREWAPKDLARLKEGMEAGSSGVLLKRSFGSDFVYRGPTEHMGLQSKGSGLIPSLAKGGLSNVWGAAMLPHTPKDIASWPVSAEELAPHYAAVLALTGLAAQEDDLAALLPLHGNGFHPLPMSRQAQRLWGALSKNRTRLRARGVQFGAARLAVRSKRSPDDAGCIACGLCMYGCPYGYIYNSAHTVQGWLETNPSFRYEPGIVVERLEENSAGVTMHGHRLDSRTPWKATGSRVFLAAGVLPSTRIMLQSEEAYEQPLYIRDSQYFLVPLLQARATPGVREEALYTLSQLFVEIQDPAVSAHTVHLQIYSYNDLIGAAMRRTLGPLGFDFFVRALENRMLVVQGYLHSDESSRLRVELHRTESGSALMVDAEVDPAVKKRVRGVVRKLLRHALSLGAVPLEPMLKIAPPGRGFHSGGTFPMRATPGKFETDTLGRPSGWSRVHLADAAVLPTIPATTITFSVMANAHRIATQAAGS